MLTKEQKAQFDSLVLCIIGLILCIIGFTLWYIADCVGDIDTSIHKIAQAYLASHGETK